MEAPNFPDEKTKEAVSMPSKVKIVLMALFILLGVCLIVFKVYGREFINDFINTSTREHHLPGYNFCGFGTRLEERLQNGDEPINPLDEACLYHDKAYNSTDLKTRHQADWALAKRAWKRVISTDAVPEERFWAFWVFLAMVFK